MPRGQTVVPLNPLPLDPLHVYVLLLCDCDANRDARAVIRCEPPLCCCLLPSAHRTARSLPYVYILLLCDCDANRDANPVPAIPSICFVLIILCDCDANRDANRRYSMRTAVMLLLVYPLRIVLLVPFLRNRLANRYSIPSICFVYPATAMRTAMLPRCELPLFDANRRSAPRTARSLPLKPPRESIRAIGRCLLTPCEIDVRTPPSCCLPANFASRTARPLFQNLSRIIRAIVRFRCLLTPATSTNTAVMLLNLCEFPPSAKPSIRLRQLGCVPLRIWLEPSVAEPSIRLRSTANSVRTIGSETFDSVAFHCGFGDSHRLRHLPCIGEGHRLRFPFDSDLTFVPQ